MVTAGGITESCTWNKITLSLSTAQLMTVEEWALPKTAQGWVLMENQDNVLNIREQCVWREKSLALIRKGVSSILGEVMVFRYLEFVRLHRKNSVDFSPPSTRKAQTWRSTLLLSGQSLWCVRRGRQEFLQCGGGKAKLSSNTVVGGIEKVMLRSSRRCVMKACEAKDTTWFAHLLIASQSLHPSFAILNGIFRILRT